MSTADRILAAEQAVEATKRAYLLSFGWKETCNTAGSYWLWARDFADLDERSASGMPSTQRRARMSRMVVSRRHSTWLYQ